MLNVAQTRGRRNTYRGVSAEQREAERRARILRAGLDVFAGRGFAGGTVRAICKEAGVSTRQFYELFSDRDDVFEAVANYAYRIMMRRTSEAALGAPPELEARLRTALEAHFVYVDDELRKAQVVVFHMGLAHPRSLANRAEAMDSLESAVAAILQPLVPHPLPEITVAALVGAVVELLWQRNAHPSPYPAEDVVDALVDLFEAALGAAQMAPAEASASR